MMFYVVVAISAVVVALIGGLIGAVAFDAFSQGAVIGAVGGLGLGAGFYSARDKLQEPDEPALPAEDEPPAA